MSAEKLGVTIPGRELWLSEVQIILGGAATVLAIVRTGPTKGRIGEVVSVSRDATSVRVKFSGHEMPWYPASSLTFHLKIGDKASELTKTAKEFFSMDRVTVEGTVLRIVRGGVVVKFDDGSINTFDVKHVTLSSRPEVTPEPSDGTYVIRVSVPLADLDIAFKSDNSVWVRDDQRAERTGADMTVRFPARWWRPGSLGEPIAWDEVSRGYETKVISGG